jgi:hypothetical protein
MRKLLIVGAAALAMFVAAPVAQAGPKFDLVAGSGTWNGGQFGTPTLHVYASDQPGAGGANDQFTINYAPTDAAPLGTTVQGPITDFSVSNDSNKGDASSCVVGQVDKSDDSRFVVGQYVPIAIAQVGGVWKFNFGASQPDEPGLCSINPDLTFDSASFTINDAP